MVHLTKSESDLVEQLLDDLATAIDDVPDVDPAYANKTKIQKLLYFAIDEFDLPVTYSWYLAGAVVPDRSIGPSSVPGIDVATDSPPGPTISEVDDEVGSPSEDPSTIDPILFNDTTGSSSPTNLRAYVSRDDLLAFYRRVLPDVWHEETMRFLQNFYQETAPERYRLLYIESTHIRTHLSDLATAIECHLEAETPTRSIAETRRALELSISDFHYYLRSDKELRETFNAVVDGTDLIEDALMMLAKRPTADYTASHLDAVRRLQDFFFYYVWKYPCLRISQTTATGPHADELRTEHATEFETFHNVLHDERGALASTLADAGLRPGPNDYPPVDDQQLAERLSNLSAEYLE
ncbi:hypothetical protein [Halarchaeum salinum]